MPFLAAIVLALAVLWPFQAPVLAAGPGEYPVAYWGQTHVREALYLHASLTPENVQTACQKGFSALSPAAKGQTGKDRDLAREWKRFAKGDRLAFCRAHPHTTWYLLGEAPYFMLPAKPGVQR